MINRLLNVLWLALMLTCSTLVMAQNTTATVDKTEITPDESFVLTLSTSLTNKPDLSVLSKSFDILGINTSSRSAYDSKIGKTIVSNSFNLTLKPKNFTGKTITVPSITIGQEKTNSITIKIIPMSDLTKGLSGKEILKMELVVPNKALYPQQNAELILRVYASENVIRARTLTAPKIANAELKSLSDTNRAIEINKNFYMLAERRYQLTPQKSGDLEIKPFKLIATVQEGRNTADKTFSTEELTLKVKPKPSNYPANAPWLPAKNLTIETKWNKEFTDIYQGDSLTRTLRITAQGLNSSQIGQITTPPIAGVRTYFDQPVFIDNKNQIPLTGIREDKQLFIFSQAGEITIPEAKIAWWNVDNDQLEYAVIPEQKIMVKPNPAYAQQQQQQPINNITNNSSNNSLANTKLPVPQTIIKTVENPNIWYWQLSTAFFVITTSLSFGLWLHARKQPAISLRENSIDSRSAISAIKSACYSNNALSARSALDNWAKLQPETINDMAARYKPLSDAIDSLNTALYSDVKDHNWNGESLWQAINSLPSKNVVNDNSNPLPPLYPNK